MPRFYTLLLLAATLSLAACQSPDTMTTASISGHVAGSQDTPPLCNAEPVQQLIGQKATSAIIAQAIKNSAAATHRVLTPNTPATLDLAQHRLNIITDAEGIIQELHCG